MSSGRGGHRQRTSARSPIWAEPAPGRRRPSVTREQIAEAALDIADAYGLDAVSMRRVAADLGVGTMTLYHYVRTKDDLFALMGDQLMAELIVPDDELPLDDWRAAIRAIARASRAAFDNHPWIFSAVSDGRIGPNGMRHFEQSLAAVASAGLAPADRLEVIAQVDDLVFGNAMRSAQEEQERHNDAWREATESYVDAELATGEFPHIEALLGTGDRREAWDRLTADVNHVDRFERGLEALLDGLERRLVNQPDPAAPAAPRAPSGPD